MAAAEYGKKRRFWQAHLRAWARSGLTQSEYCRRRGLSRSMFGYWRSRFGGAQESALDSSQVRRRQSTPVRLVAVAPRAVEAAFGAEGGWQRRSAAVSVLVGARYRVEVGDGFVPETLARLLRTLEAL